MSPQRNHATRTVTEDGRIVPWLAASGPLSYSPENPPSSNYYFQYSWILPGIFAPTTNKRRHFYFGASVRDDAAEVLSFWETARAGRAIRVACELGNVDVASGVVAPLAVYSFRDYRYRAAYLLMQHGSYQVVPADDQPLLRLGEIVLYRGVQTSRVFRFIRMVHASLDGEQRGAWQRYAATQAQVLSDSVVSFNSIHDRAKRCETSHILDQTWVSDEIAEANGLKIAGVGLAPELWRAANQSFTLRRWVAEAKFGPHFVKCRTPIGNVRITTFFAGEHEARIIDPDLVEFVESQGCRVERHGPSG